MAYQGPNVQVIQSFQTTPAATSIESNPAMIIATSYLTYRRNSQGTFQGGGLTTVPFLWKSGSTLVDDVVWENDNSRKYNMFPVVVTAKQGSLERVLTAIEDYTVASTGISVAKNAAYTLAEVAFDQELRIPYLLLATADVTKVDKVWTVASTVSLSAAGIVAGLPVKSGANLTTIVSVSGQSITLADDTAVSNPVIGMDSTGTYCTTMTRKTGNWLASGCRAGDMVRFTVSGDDTEQLASIVAVSTKVITFQTATTAKPANLVEVETCNAFSTAQIVVSATIERLIGFSGLTNNAITGAWSTNVFEPRTRINTGIVGTWTTDTFGPTSPATVVPWTVVPELGDTIVSSTGGSALVTAIDPTSKAVTVASVIATTGTVSSYDVLAWTSVPALGDIVVNSDASKQATVIAIHPTTKAVTVSEVIATSGTVDIYKPSVSSTILADFRSVNVAERGTIKRITTTQDIKDFYCDGESIDSCNELAQMAFEALTLAGGVCYACNVRPDSVDEYALALESSLMKEVYSISLGTTSAAINALIPAHVNAASDPYEARERIGVTAYDTDDVFVLATSGSVTSTDGVLTGFDFDPTLVGVQAGDVVTIDDAGTLTTATVAVTPTGMAIVTDSDMTHADLIITVRTADTSVQAEKLAALAVGDRRVTVVFPGWFQATDALSTTRNFPPYYISAAVSGLDSGLKASQSMTNLKFQIPGLSNLSLDTNFKYRKSELDTIGGGGIDIFIQDADTTNAIYSRHDLSTDMSSVEYRERSVTKQVDTVAKSYRSMSRPYLGRYNINGPQGDRLITFLKQAAMILNGILVKQEVCASVTLNSIVRDSLVADKLNWDVAVTVYIAGNYYEITLNVVSR